jgi:hypothetical protein
MTETPAPSKPDRKPAGDDRDARLAAALRVNLARRKAQKRARYAGSEPARPPRERG